MKFEMEFGFLKSEKIIIETTDFEKIKIIQEFIEFQTFHNWDVDYEEVSEFDFDLEDEDTEEEEAAE
jgi:hypothetical protein